MGPRLERLRRPGLRPARPGRRGCAIALALSIGLAASGSRGDAPADASAGSSSVQVPALLGADHAALRERFGEALRPVETARARSVFEQAAPDGDASAPAGPPQIRLTRGSAGDVRRVEYDLADGRVYRVRWQLAERFERPILMDVVARLAERLGRPDYDQILRAELGSRRADLRRTGWTLGRRLLEVRQLHPFTGGPLFLSLADLDALQAIVDAKGVPLPQPDATGAWWRRPQRSPELPTEEERRRLVAAIDALVARLAQAPDRSSPAPPPGKHTSGEPRAHTD